MKQKLLDLLNIVAGLRKTIVMVLVMAICVGFRIVNKMSGENIVELLKATIIAYFSANGVEHFTSMVKERMISKIPGSVPDAIKEGEEMVTGIEADATK